MKHLSNRSVFMICATIVAVFVMIVLSLLGGNIYNWLFGNPCCEDDRYCYYTDCVGGNIYYHRGLASIGYVFDGPTDKKLIKNVWSIDEPAGNDTLVCFYNGRKYGYFGKYSGKIVAEPIYDHAWAFSDGRAFVDDGTSVKLVDAALNVIADTKLTYEEGLEFEGFQNGLCVVGYSKCDSKYGLMDPSGNLVLPMEYSRIVRSDYCDLWVLRKGDESCVVNQHLEQVLPYLSGYIYVGEETIDVTMKKDHTKRKYTWQGELIHDFYITNFRTLEYEEDEFLYQVKTHDEYGREYSVPVTEAYRPKKVARLRAYVAGDGYEGLMTADGHVVTMPLYWNIEALDHDLYLCSTKDDDKVIVNGKGEIVR